MESTSNLGATGNNPAGNWINTLQFVDNFSHITPRHEWKFGGEVRNIRDNRVYDLFFNGQLGFTGSAQSRMNSESAGGLCRRSAELFAAIRRQLGAQLPHHELRLLRPGQIQAATEPDTHLWTALRAEHGLARCDESLEHVASEPVYHIPPAQRGSNQSRPAPGIGHRHAETARRPLRWRSQQLRAAHRPGLVARRVASDRPSRRIWDFLRHGFREYSWQRDVESAVLARLLHPLLLRTRSRLGRPVSQ